MLGNMHGKVIIFFGGGGRVGGVEKKYMFNCPRCDLDLR